MAELRTGTTVAGALTASTVRPLMQNGDTDVLPELHAPRWTGTEARGKDDPVRVAMERRATLGAAAATRAVGLQAAREAEARHSIAGASQTTRLTRT